MNSCFHKWCYTKQISACRMPTIGKIAKSCGFFCMFGISHVRFQAAWNLVTVTPFGTFLSQINEQLGNGKLIGHLKLLEKNNISQQMFTKNTSYCPSTWPLKSAETHGFGNAAPFETPLAASIVCSMRFGCHMGIQFCNAKSRGHTSMGVGIFEGTRM